MIPSGTAPPPGWKLSCAAMTAPVDVPVVESGEQARSGGADLTSFPLQVAARGVDLGIPVHLEAVARPTAPSHRPNIAAKTT